MTNQGDVIFLKIVAVFGVNIAVVDIIALLFFIGAWFAFSFYALRAYHHRPNLMGIMNRMRLKWIRQLLKRESRVSDASLMGNLLRSISFFANTSIFILMGLMTLIGYRDSAVKTLDSIPFAVHSSILMWEFKVVTLIVIFIYAFFKFTWSLRQYNYCCVLVGAAPLPSEATDKHDAYASKAGSLLANAASHFNMGLRAYYFGLAATSWFIHPLLFMAVTLLVVIVLYRREFHSYSLNNLAGMGDDY